MAYAMLDHAVLAVASRQWLRYLSACNVSRPAVNIVNNLNIAQINNNDLLFLMRATVVHK